MKSQSDPFFVAAERLLVFEAGGELRSVEHGAAAATELYDRLQRSLSPVIGEAGFDALVARALKLTQAQLPALSAIDAGAPKEHAFKQLCACLQEQTPAGIAEIVSSLLVTFITLLSTFIGEGLTWKLLRNAWPDVLASGPSGEKP